MKLKENIIYLIFCLMSCTVFSQSTIALTLPVVTLLDIEPTGTFTLNFTAPTEAGQALTAPAANTTKWINYTSAIASGGLTRRITASINQLVPGISIRVQAAAASGSGGGTLGTSAGQVTLSTTATNIITGIGGAFTGNGANNGHRLTISVAVNTYANLSALTNSPIVITYTITE
ncbi:hypothetical protein EG346_08515 [Chryseobacterium carnipullorum]|uniref:DUF4402 domain-containing protein n=2 Tax=Chryseobacterium carnipullorum TaxID=1124835 RepID=A0A1M7AVI9_CHRCU|nr:hypothetical protein [Chryseobacterium carnipullorum]AZA48222.1 hypothetical protein EG346_08515 [Chryseobacterium carnipullorum]AZA67526.1 hypothetical protein EG345_24730 [Chryseobacterium carnipullorum]SHL46439.1 hypothetical protein SAMN05444360_1022 [Chryseobacterium carnipullorum]STC91451.1 Uncharacterised protein [Chryseobacterium carnipullorum]STD14755.1 Uncharacterised protein [Chryseobacterium carnipullorum]